MRTPALIFDFGNVLAHFDYGRAAEAVGRPIGLSGPELLERVRPLGFSQLLKDYESGRVRAETFSREVCRLAGVSMSHEAFAAAWADIFWLNESVAALVADLKRKGYRLVLGSNTNDMHAAHFRRQFAAALENFDRLILSYEVGHIKPSAAFYLACAEAAGADPAGCVFIDDVEENVKGAWAAGLVGLHYRDTARLKEELSELGVDVSAE